MEFYTVVLLSVVAVVSLIIIVKSPVFSTAMLKKHKKLNDEYMKDLEDERDYFKKQARANQLQKNNRERGVAVDGQGDFADIVPEIVKGIAPFIPEKLRPLFADTEISGAIINQVLKEPDKYKQVIKGMIAKTKTPAAAEESSDFVQGV